MPVTNAGIDCKTKSVSSEAVGKFSCDLYKEDLFKLSFIVLKQVVEIQLPFYVYKYNSKPKSNQNPHL
jgi:hypothetical protein